MHVSWIVVILFSLVFQGCTQSEKQAAISSGAITEPQNSNQTTLLDCSAANIKLKTSDGTITNHEDLQIAVNQADSGSIIEVGSIATDKTITISKKNSLTLKTTCLSSIKSISIVESSNVTVDGFLIEAAGLLKPGIEIASEIDDSTKIYGKPKDDKQEPQTNKGDKENSHNQIASPQNSDSNVSPSPVASEDPKKEPKKENAPGPDDSKDKKDNNEEIADVTNESEDLDDEHEVKTSNIVIQNCRIQHSDLTYAGVKVHGGIGKLTFLNNYIFENGADGIAFSDSSRGGPHLLEKNIISYNTKNGVVIPKKQKITLKDNLIVANGTGMDGGYGIKRNGKAEFSPTNTTLIGNVIAFNHGKVKRDNSSQDISFYAGILDGTDSGNKTTTGTEGLGIVKLEDTTAPKINLANQDNQRTSNPVYWLEVIVEDSSPVETQVFQNGALILTTKAFILEQKVQLTEGTNTFLISSKDAFGNISVTTELKSIILDTIPPKIAADYPPQGSTFYTNQYPFSFKTGWNSDEPLSKALIQSGAANIVSDQVHFSKEVSLSQAGAFTIPVEASDLVNNTSQSQLAGNLVFDNVAPIVSIKVPATFRTKEYTIVVPVVVEETSPVWTAIYINDEKLYETSALRFDSPVFPLQEGENIFKIIAKDAAGNISNVNTATVIRDTTSPTIIELSPENESFLSGLQIPVQVSANEKLSSAIVNGLELTLSSDGLSADGTYTAAKDGPTPLQLTLTDLVGNTTTRDLSVTLVLKPLIANLVTIVPDEIKNKLIINGAVGATRPGLTVKASVGLFTSQSVIANSNGSFAIVMDPFSQVVVSVYDPVTRTTTSATLVYGDSTGTILSGSVRDTNNQPLVGVSVTIYSTGTKVKTNADGVFTFTSTNTGGQLITGDQLLLIDGTTAIPSGPSDVRRFTAVTVPITVGLSQNNVMQRPIYLAPLILNGQETVLSSSRSTTVTNENLAPGVKLEIPANVTQFPNGSTTGAISIQEIPAEVTTVPPPAVAKPKSVIALEPSGTTFSEPIDLTLPNKNHFPPKTDMVILLMNSKTGLWEIGGVGQVDDSGTSIKTKPGQGIKHFSLAYASVLSPDVRQVGAKDKPGADSFDGAVSSQIKLPSFKSLGKEITPALQYNSAWAKPNAFITNVIHAPTKVLTLNEKSTFGGFKYNSIDVERCIDKENVLTGARVPVCFPLPEGYYQFTQYEKNITGTLTYKPKQLLFQFQVADYISPIHQFTALLDQSLVSFGVDLKSGENEYVPSGIYPYRAHYELQYEELVVGTIEVREKGALGAPQISQPIETPENQELTKVFPPDQGGPIYIQNYVNSAVGRGWRIGGVQSILPPSGNRVAIEEADGKISTYNSSDTIETVINISSAGGDLNNGVGLNAWPKVHFLNSEATQVYEADLSKSLNKYSIGSIYNWSGRLEGYDFVNAYEPHIHTSERCTDWLFGVVDGKCTEWTTDATVHNHPISLCQKDSFDYEIKAKPSHLYLRDDGAIFGADPGRNSIFKLMNGSSEFYAGLKIKASTVGNYYASSQPINLIDSANHYCDSVDIQCRQISQAATGWTSPEHNSCGSITLSVGQVPYTNRRIGIGEGLNKPMSIIKDPFDAKYAVVADSGANVVRRVSLQAPSSSYTILAGNRTATDTLVQNFATGSGIFHPRGVVYDNAGNLYISSEGGYIRKVTRDNMMSIFAGKPSGGSLADGIPAQEITLNQPYGMVIDHSKNFLYVADTGHHRVVRIDLVTNLAITVAGGNDQGYSGDGGLALSAQLNSPTHLWLDPEGNLIITDAGNQRIRRVVFSGSSTGTLSLQPTSGDKFPSLVRKSDSSWERVYRDGTKISFDQFGRQTSSVDRSGHKFTFEYDNSGRLKSITDPVNQKITYTYSGDKLDNIQDPAGRITYFSYTMEGQLKQVTFPDSNTKRFEYNQKGLLEYEYNERNKPLQYVYNQYDRLEKVIKPNSPAITITDSGSATVLEQPKNGEEPQTAPTLKESPSIITDANGNPTKVIKDFQGYIFSITDAENRVTELHRDLKGRTTKVIRPDQTYLENTYDQETGDLLKVVDTRTGESVSTSYDSYGNETSHRDSRGFTYLKTYDPNTGWLINEISPGNRIVEYTYWPNGLLKTKTIHPKSGESLISSFEYDAVGNLTKANERGIETQFRYNPAGNLIEKIEKKDSNLTLSTKYDYDAFNRLTKVTTPRLEVTEYHYLPTGELSEIIDPKKNSTIFTYNDLGQLSSKTEADGSQYTFTYDGNGNRKTETDPNKNLKEYDYNSANKLTKVKLPDDIIQYDYNNEMKVTKITSNNTIIDFTLDEKNRVSALKEQGIGNLADYPLAEMQFSFDANDNRRSFTTALGTTTYDYDELNRLTSLTNRLGQAFGFDYDDASRLRSQTRPNGRTAYSYNPNGQLAGITHSSNGVTLAAFNYLFDERNLIKQKRTLAGEFNYVYDNNGQLESASHPTLALEQFSYDPLGNRITDQSGSYIYDDKSQRLTEDYQFKYFYDANGNLTQKIPKNPSAKGFVYNYSSTNQLVEMSITDGATGPRVLQIKYAYDPLGKRLQKEVINFQDTNKSYVRKYIYDGENVLFEYDSNNSLIAEYTYSPLRPDDLLAVDIKQEGVSAKLAKTQGSYFYLKDHLGSITEITNENGNVVQKYEYSSFGKIVSITDNIGTDITADPFLRTTYSYTGREYEEESGLFYYRARYYDPSVGKFLQKDPDPGKLGVPITVINSSIYVGNNPISYRDPTGKIAFLALVGISALIGFVTNLSAGLGQNASLGDAFKYALIGAVQGALTPIFAAGLGMLGVGAVTAGVIGTIAAGALGGYATAKTFGGDAGTSALLGGIAAGIGLAAGVGFGRLAFDLGVKESVKAAVNYGAGAIGAMAFNTGYGPPEEPIEQQYRPGYYIRVER